MTFELIKRTGIFIALCLMQALVLNRIHLFDCATPLLYVYFAITIPRNHPKWAVLLWCFLLGLAIDTFSNTPGVASASLTLIGAIQPYYLELFIPREATEDLVPSASELGTMKYSFYAGTLIILYCLAFFTLESFNFFNWLQWLECVGGSAALTFVLILTIESVSIK